MKLRHEFKHYINLSDYHHIKSRLINVAHLDQNANEDGKYKIRSLYFDNYNDTALFEKISGLNNRCKFRIRTYNDNDSFIRLEKKSKINGLCKKIISPISKQECENILKADLEILKTSDKQVFKELYVKMTNEFLKPKTIVDYIREAYIYDAGNVRITFDTSVKTGMSSTDIFNKTLPMMETLDPRFIILEVKYDEFLPDIISNIIQVGERTKSAISKYALCRMYY